MLASWYCRLPTENKLLHTSLCRICSTFLWNTCFYFLWDTIPEQVQDGFDSMCWLFK